MNRQIGETPFFCSKPSETSVKSTFGGSPNLREGVLVPAWRSRLETRVSNHNSRNTSAIIKIFIRYYHDV